MPIVGHTGRLGGLGITIVAQNQVCFKAWGLAWQCVIPARVTDLSEDSEDPLQLKECKISKQDYQKRKCKSLDGFSGI